jgi:hypothetical protein
VREKEKGKEKGGNTKNKGELEIITVKVYAS